MADSRKRSYYLSEDMTAKVEALATERCRSLSHIMQQALTVYLESGAPDVRLERKPRTYFKRRERETPESWSREVEALDLDK